MKNDEYCQQCRCYSCFHDPAVCDVEENEAFAPCTDCEEEGFVVSCNAWMEVK